MAELNIAVKHGQTAEAARANLDKAIARAHVEYGRWVRRVDWSADRRTAILAGPGYEVELHFDDVNVYARGQVPLAVKLLEGPVRRFVERTLGPDSSA